MSGNVLVVADPGAARPSPAVRELLTAAQQLTAPEGGRIAALVFGPDAVAAEWGALGVDTVYLAGCASADDVVPELQLAATAEAAAREAASAVLLAHDVTGTELAPRLAFRLDGAAALGCVELARDAGGIRCTRPCYGGLVREDDRFDPQPLVATVRPGVYARAEACSVRVAEVVDLGAFDTRAVRVRRVERRLDAPEGVRLEDARTVVAGGRGLGGPEGFEILGALARELGAAVGASRVACDLGWCPHSWQIGLTGKTVTPELYIAVGISGAGHHMAGCGNAKAIVAINADPEAAIFQEARFGVVGDYREIVPAMTDALRRLNATRAAKD